jgi:hypothetical protein
MWEEINKELKKYLKNYQIKQKILEDNLSDILERRLTIDEFVNYGNGDKLKRKLLEKTFPKNSYLQYLKEYYLSKPRLTNKEIIHFLILLEYWRFNGDLKTEQMFANILSIVYSNALKQVPNNKLEQVRPLNILEIELMNLPNHLGWIWSEYVMNEIVYNANQILKQYSIDLAQGNVALENYRKILEKQQRMHLNITTIEKQLKEIERKAKGLDDKVEADKKKQEELKREIEELKEKYSGAVESQINFLVNQCLYIVFQDAEVEKVIFLGVNDSRQTKMCHSLDGQVFWLDKINKFERYSDSVGKIIEYEVFGLVSGINLPPIDDHTHYCRSTIEAVEPR